MNAASSPTRRSDANGYVALACWLKGLDTLVKVGVEGTGSCGASLARHLRVHGVEVVEVNRPNRQMRRQHGESDPVDAGSPPGWPQR